MTDEIAVILPEVDGAELRRWQHKYPYYARADGKQDDEQINGALGHVGVLQVAIPAEDWERIFGGANGRR